MKKGPKKKKKTTNFCQMPEPMWSNFPSPRQIAIGNFKALIIPWELLLFCPLQFLAPHQCRAGHADKFPKWDEFDSPWAWHLVAQGRNASYFSKQLQGRDLKLSHHPHSVEAKIHGLSPNLLPLSRWMGKEVWEALWLQKTGEKQHNNFWYMWVY